MRCDTNRSWQVLLLGGASGTGKTSISYRLAHHFGVGITEVDDFQIVLERMTTPMEQPILHRCWGPEAARLSPEQIVELQIAVVETPTPALEAVVDNHIKTNTPIILEGDYILPSLASRCPATADRGGVRAVFLHEPDETQLQRNFSYRDVDGEEQRHRARVSWLFSQWLKAEAQRRSLPVVEARPWATVFDRVQAVIA